MTAPVRVGAFFAGLLVVFAAALGVGNAAGPRPAPAAEHGAAGHADASHAEAAPVAATVELPAGLQVSEEGFTLVPETTALAVGAQDFRFRILGPDFQAVTAYTPTHERDLHLIVVRRDLTGFQHVHPALGADGAWQVALTLADPGTYRVYADFAPAPRATALVLGADLFVAGEQRTAPLPAPAAIASVDGYDVELAGTLTPGQRSRLTLTVRRGGAPVTDLQPYLGAYGHLVALRAGDLAYLHVHPQGTPTDGTTTPGPAVVFDVEVPSAGDYALFLDFRQGDTVRTASWTVRSEKGTSR